MDKVIMIIEHKERFFCRAAKVDSKNISRTIDILKKCALRTMEKWEVKDV